MKKTININLGGLVFTIDEDAYDRLSRYIDALKQKFTNLEEQNEIIQDIEYRFAELFSANINKSNEVVNISMVNSAIAAMGEPEEIEDELENNENPSYQNQAGSSENVIKKLFRDPDDKIFAGVISGFAKYLGIKDPIWLRIFMVLVVFAGIGFPIGIYFLLWLLVPIAKTASDKLQMNGDPINLDNIEDQVRKNINTDEIKRSSVRITNKLGELLPLIVKIVVILLIVFFMFNLFGLVMVLFAGGFTFSIAKPEFINLFLDTNSTFYIAIISLFVLLSIPVLGAIYAAVKLLTRNKINWGLSISTFFLMAVLSVFGLLYSAYQVFGNFKQSAEQTNFVAIQDPTVDELEIIFPYTKLKENLNLSFNFGDNDEDDSFQIDGIEVLASQKKIKINLVDLNIRMLENDTIFKLSKTIYSKGKTVQEAEEKLEHITSDFDIVNEKAIAIPKMMVLENETKWRNQKLKYDLFVPIGKKIYFGENAKQVVNFVQISGDFSKKNLANNTWEMTKSGLKCLSCTEISEE